MLIPKDTIYNDTREKSVMQWLEGMSQHEDIAVRDGVRVTTDYINHLKEEIKNLEETNALTRQYLKQMTQKAKGQK